jgi:hypothetical protein
VLWKETRLRAAQTDTVIRIGAAKTAVREIRLGEAQASVEHTCPEIVKVGKIKNISQHQKHNN